MTSYGPELFVRPTSCWPDNDTSSGLRVTQPCRGQEMPGQKSGGFQSFDRQEIVYSEENSSKPKKGCEALAVLIGPGNNSTVLAKSFTAK